MNHLRNKDVLELQLSTRLKIPGTRPMTRIEYTLCYYCVCFASMNERLFKPQGARRFAAAAPRSRSPLRSLSLWIPLLTQLHKWSNGNIAYAYRPYNRTSTPPVDKESSPAAANATLRRRVRRRGVGTSTHPSSLVHRRQD